MVIKGVPYSRSVSLCNIDFIQKPQVELDISLYALLQLVLDTPKNYVVIVDNTYLTWLDDIYFDLKNKECFIPYFRYDVQTTDIPYVASKQGSDHLVFNKTTNTVIVRHNFELCYYTVIDSLFLYSIEQDKLYSVHITDYITEEFSVQKAYTLYKQACYFDLPSEFAKHEGGYSFIIGEFKGFRNNERRYRKTLGLESFKSKPPKKIDCSDVRYYTYLDYIGKFNRGDTSSDELFKYRNLRFMSYLYCCLRQGLTPIDCEEWNQLGIKKRYIKLKDDIPFFFKYYWLNEYSMQMTESWLQK